MTSTQRGLGMRLLVSSLVVLAGLVAGVVGWRLWPDECGAASGIRLNDEKNHECIGVTEGAYLFNDPATGPWNDEDRRVIAKINDVQRRIETANKEAAETGRYVKVVLLMPLTVSHATPSAISLNQILYSLQGSYTALVRANEEIDFPGSRLPRLQLLLANQGSQQEAGNEFMDGILEMSESEHPVVAVVGLGSSVPNTKIAAGYLAGKEVPMVSAVTSADDLTSLPLMWSVSPSNLDYARALREHLDDQDLLKTGLIVYDRNRDLYTRSLAEAYRTELKNYIRYPDQPFQGSTIETPAAPNVFGSVVRNLCNAAMESEAPLDMVFFAGRIADFGAFAEALSGPARTCTTRPLTVLVGATGFAAAENYREELKKVNVTVVYATSSDSASWMSGKPGTPPGFAKFLQVFLDNGFDEADLADGYAIAHHDALLTAAQAIQIATQERQGRVPSRQDVINEFGHLSLAQVVPAASGELTLPPEGGRATGRLIPIQEIK